MWGEEAEQQATQSFQGGTAGKRLHEKNPLHSVKISRGDPENDLKQLSC